MIPISQFMGMFPYFHDPSWNGWRHTVGPLIDGLTPADVELARRITGRETFGTGVPPREAFIIKGRGGGGTRFSSVLEARAGAFGQFKTGPGEQIFVITISPSRQQSALNQRYTSGLLHDNPALEALIVNETQDTIELSTNVTIANTTADHRTIRGRAVALAVVEEAAFLPTDNASSPDTEILRALRPALARVPGSQLIVISSPYARRGELYKAWRQHFGKDGSTLVIQAPTQVLNPAFDPEELRRAYEEDPVSAEAEYGAQFRSDVENAFTREVLDALIDPGVHERPPVGGISYRAFVDPSGGSADSFTLAIGHSEKQADGTMIELLDALRERRPPFSPEQVVSEFAETLKTYKVSTITGDAYAGEWPREQFRKHGIVYNRSERNKSEIYTAAIPLFNSGRVRLLDGMSGVSARLMAQLGALERRTSRVGKDSIDHPPHGRDDIANSACGVLTMQAAGSALRVRALANSIQEGNDLRAAFARSLMAATRFNPYK
jgi:hypothetical protein